MLSLPCQVAANYKTTSLAEAVGYFVLGRVLSSHIYQAQIGPDGGNTCIGADCFRLTFFIAAGLELTGLAATFWLYRRTRKPKAYEPL